MSVTTLISWYDEDPSWLSEAVASVASFSNQVVALDGAYALFPKGHRVSSFNQSYAIRVAARQATMGCTIVEPSQPWSGNEVEKRSAMFAVAEALTTEDDWYFILDADEYVEYCHYENLSSLLESIPEDIGNVHVLDKGGVIRVYPKLYRAIRGLRVVGNHWTYELEDGRRLWGHAKPGKPPEPVGDLSSIKVIHRQNRGELREKAAQLYYYIRSQETAEFDP